jgi:hypothetical protein
VIFSSSVFAPTLYGGGGGGNSATGNQPQIVLGTQGAIILTWSTYTTSTAEMMWRPQPGNLKLRGKPAHSRTYLHRKWYSTYRQTPYHTISSGPWVIVPGPGQSNIRNIEPKLRAFNRDSTPQLED